MTNQKTLYLSDLDGTLLRADQTLSPFTRETLDALMKRGMLFSYATARSLTTATKVTAGLSQTLPAILFNGTFIMEPATGKRLVSNLFREEDARWLLDLLLSCGVYPVVNAFLDGEEKFFYCEGKESRGMELFLRERWNDKRRTPVSSPDALYRGEIFHIACMDESQTLAPLYERFKDQFPTVFYRDLYSGEMWLELHPNGATKADAMLALKKLLGCERVVCFGDGKNDISMFRAADECYAVENADEELKAIATGIIGSNGEDGVARWLSEHFM